MLGLFFEQLIDLEDAPAGAVTAAAGKAVASQSQAGCQVACPMETQKSLRHHHPRILSCWNITSMSIALEQINIWVGTVSIFLVGRLS